MTRIDTIGLFPGQGAQFVGMLDGFAGERAVRETLEEASDVLSQDLWALAAQGPAALLNDTVNTQPLMLATVLGAYRAWTSRTGLKPVAAAGHSLGEITAYTAAGTFAFADAVRLVRRRAQWMQDCAGGTGGMAAVVGLPGTVVDAICRACRAEGLCVEAVNFNEPEQTVIAGLEPGLSVAQARCEQAGARRVLPLPVSAPFHTSLLEPVGAALRRAMLGLHMQPARFPVVNNLDAVMRTEPAEVMQALALQAHHPVRWVDGLRVLARQDAVLAFEFGPGRTLANFAKKCGWPLKVMPVSDSATLDAAVRAVETARRETAERAAEPAVVEAA